MTPTELEQWSRRVVAAALGGHSVEDSIVELKANWPSADKAAEQLAGHANAAHGEHILWIVGVDENNRKLSSIDPAEKGDWYQSIQKCFDGFAPRLEIDINFEVNDSALASLYFDTRHEAPFVIKSTTGGYPQYIVPWRTGTSKRAASRSQLLSILVPQRTLAKLRRETEFNRTVASGAFGGVFRTDQFDKALEDGILDDIPVATRDRILSAYAKIDLCNHMTIGYHQFSGNWNARGVLQSDVMRTFQEMREVIDALSALLQKTETESARDT